MSKRTQGDVRADLFGEAVVCFARGIYILKRLAGNDRARFRYYLDRVRTRANHLVVSKMMGKR